MRSLVAAFAFVLPVLAFAQSPLTTPADPEGVRVLEKRSDGSVTLEAKGEQVTVQPIQVAAHAEQSAQGGTPYQPPRWWQRGVFVEAGMGYSTVQNVKAELVFLVEAGGKNYLVVDAAPGLKGGKLALGFGREYGGPCYTVCFFDPTKGLVHLSGVIYRGWGKNAADAPVQSGENYAGAEINWMPGTPLINLSAAYLKRVTGAPKGKSTVWLFSGSVRIPVWWND